VRRAALVFLAAALAPPAAAQVAEPEGYRMEEYSAPVPATLEGASVVGPQEAHALWEAGETAFIDALPWTPRPANLPEGTMWREKPRDSIPGAIWLANTGYGDLAEVMHDYFRAGLDDVTEGDPGHPVLFFCLADCWMSWNAAKRALAEGYTEVYWMPEGTDGWTAAGYPLERVTPYPGHP
jgi:PQQ-dependent catabolism-associated CXXCW motif protein